MNRTCIQILCCLLLAGPIAAYGQEEIPQTYTSSPDSIALYLSCRYRDESSRLEALYRWMTATMKYNVYLTFESRNEVYTEEKDVRNTLHKRSGVCRNFALVFKKVAEAMDIPAFVVDGYVKEGTTLMTDPHAWNCAKVDGQWLLYDVTFGMGQVNNNQFVSKPTMEYCHCSPLKMLENHMPFDPIWQLTDRPFPYQVYDGQAGVPGTDVGTTISFNDSIRNYLHQDNVERARHSLQRMQRNGTANPLVTYYMDLTRSNIEVYKKQGIYDIYKTAMQSLNKAVDYYNEFVHYRKAGFEPAKEEQEVRDALGKIEQNYLLAYRKISSLTQIPEEYSTAILSLQESIKQIGARTEKQKEFVETYYKTSPSKRKQLFAE